MWTFYNSSGEAMIIDGGGVAQFVSTLTGAAATGTTTIPLDDSPPQIGEGDEYMTLAITPNNTNNKLVIQVTWVGSTSVAGTMAVALFQDSTSNALACAADVGDGGTIAMRVITFTHIMDAGTTSSTTFRVRAGQDNSNTTSFNGRSGSRIYGGVCASSIKIWEFIT